MVGGYYPGNNTDYSDLKQAKGNRRDTEDETLKQMGDRSYRIDAHILNSIHSIEKVLTNGSDFNKTQLEDFRMYLENVSFKFNKILQEEKAENIPNHILEREFRRVTKLLSNVSSILYSD